MRNLTKSATVAATTAMLLVSTAAVARPGDRHRGHDRIDAGDVIAGALIIGGIAAVASAASNNRNDRGYDYRDRDYRGDRGYGYDDNRGYGNNGYGDNGYYQNGYGSRAAVDQCVRAAQIEARRYGNARVTDVTRIDRIRGGYEVRGRLVVQDRNWNGWRGHRGGWDRGNQYGRYNEGYERGRFSCVTRRGSVQDVDLIGLRTY